MRKLLQAVAICLAGLPGAGSLAAAAPITDHQLRELWQEGDLPGMQRLAEAGDLRAQRWMGEMLHDRGLYDDAIHWYARAVAQGDGRSASAIAHFHERGIGRPKDPGKAIDWYRRGAVRGDAESQTRYAAALHAGDLIPRDEAEAYRWYAAAVRQRYGYAYLPLAEMSAQGAGTARDLRRAHALAQVAELAVDDSDFENQRRARSLRSNVAAQLRPQERREAERLFAALRPDLAERLARRRGRAIGVIGLILMLAAAPVAIAFRSHRRVARRTPA